LYILDETFLGIYSARLDLDRRDALMGLAGAISASPLFSRIKDASIIVRPSPTPLLAICGSFEEEDIARLDALAEQLKAACSSMRYENYARVEEACRKLGRRLIDRFGREAIEDFRFMALPRGGLIVLGILSYVLDLRPSQLDICRDPEKTLVAVDDCALTGHRFGQFLKNCNRERMVFAPLYSHPQLRKAVRDEEPKVIACLSGEDLKEMARDYDSQKSAIGKRMAEILGDGRYIVNPIEYICFPWNEPDWCFWNDVTQDVECGWHVIPPKLCLKNWENRDLIQVQKEGKGYLRPSKGVVFAERAGEVLIANIETNESLSLQGSAAEMWKTLIGSKDDEEALMGLLKAFDVEEEVLRKDYMSLVEDLIGRKLIEENGRRID